MMRRGATDIGRLYLQMIVISKAFGLLPGTRLKNGYTTYMVAQNGRGIFGDGGAINPGHSAMKSRYADNSITSPDAPHLVIGWPCLSGNILRKHNSLSTYGAYPEGCKDVIVLCVFFYREETKKNDKNPEHRNKFKTLA